MLAKLLKYDFKKIYKFLIIFYSLAIFFAILTRIFFQIDNSFVMSIVAKICSGATISMIVSIIINNVMRLWVKFKNTLYDDESYLTHTLPVTKSSLYISKIITAILTMLTSVIVIALTLFIAYYSKENIETLKNLILPIADILDSSIIGVVILFLAVLLIETLNIIQVGFTGIILGHKANNNKVALSVIFGFAVYMFTQTISLLGAFLISLFNKDMMNLFITNEVINIDMIKALALVCIVIYTSIFIINLIINILIFKKGVNVD